MNISYNEKEKQFHLYNDEISYVMCVLANGDLGHLYYGKRINENQIIKMQSSQGGRPMGCCAKEDENYSREFTMLEYPSFGNGDFRVPAFEIEQENGSRVTEFKYADYRIFDGKKKLPGLPATYANFDDEVKTLEIICRDDVINAEMILSYSIWEKYPVICKNVTFINKGTQSVKLNRALSTCIDLPENDYQWIQFDGAWARERHPLTRNLDEGITAIESMRGHSSSNFNPFVIVKRKNTDDMQGEAIGFNFVYSGNFLAQAESDTFGKLRITMGINPRWFCWPLGTGEEFVTPEVVMTYSSSGMNYLSQVIHKLFNNNLVRSKYKNKRRPILLNNWEATEMDFTEESILKIAKKGAEAGIDLFVLDDGWFGKRDDDYAGLGDWYENTKKLPDKMAGLSKKVHDLGIDFGFWIEPEMVNEDSDLYRNHPDWILGVPGRPNMLGRHQMVLDYSKPEVVDYIYGLLEKVINGSDINYIKWDMNRSITECYSIGEAAGLQGTIYHKYIMGVYSLYEKLMAAFPEILFESCASGGCRFDAGMLYYAPQAWGSDDTDAYERLLIQYGTSYGYPIVSIGSHVSASPNNQTGRPISIDTRANVAYFGTFGYELDLNEISDDEFKKVKSQIEFMREYGEIIQYGDLYRLKSPYENNISGWMSVSEDKNTAVVGIYKGHSTVNTGYVRMKLQGLDRDAIYHDDKGNAYYGDYLEEAGLDVTESAKPWYDSTGDYISKVVVLKK